MQLLYEDNQFFRGRSSIFERSSAANNSNRFLGGNLRLFNLKGSWLLLKRLSFSQNTATQWGIANIVGHMALYGTPNFLDLKIAPY